jgi:hypothetical protein
MFSLIAETQCWENTSSRQLFHASYMEHARKKRCPLRYVVTAGAVDMEGRNLRQPQRFRLAVVENRDRFKR